MRLFSLALACALLTSGCAGLSATPPLSPPLQLVTLGAVSPETPLVWSDDGRWLAYVDGGLRLRRPESEASRLLVPGGAPRQIAFAPGGDEVVVAQSEGEETLLRRYRLTDGTAVGAVRVAGRCDGLLWPQTHEIVALQVTGKRFSFGGNYSARLLRWDGDTAVRDSLLLDTTLKPLTLRDWGGVLDQVPRLRLSPWRDEILVNLLRDPPAFPPYLDLQLIPLAGGAPRSLAHVALPWGGGSFDADGARVLINGADTVLRLRDPWTGAEASGPPAVAGEIALSPGGRYLLAGDALYRDNHLLTRFPAAVRGAFGVGGRLALISGGRLYLLTGLVEERSALPPADEERRARLLQLRQWRSRGLISHSDYLSQQELP